MAYGFSKNARTFLNYRVSDYFVKKAAIQKGCRVMFKIFFFFFLLYFIFIVVYLIQQCFLIYKMPLIQHFQYIYDN